MNTNRTNPLDQIEFWFSSLPEHLQEDFATIANHYHIAKEIFKQNDLKGFLAYLDSSNMSDRDIIARTLYLIKLFEFCFTGKETEEDWKEGLVLLLSLSTKVSNKGDFAELANDEISKFKEIQKLWMDAASSWSTLVQTELSNRKLSEWYVQPFLRKRRE